MTNPERYQLLAHAILAWIDKKPIQYAVFDIDPRPHWNDFTGEHPIFYNENLMWRVKPEPVSRPWSKPDDVPGPVCWLRSGYLGIGMIQWIDSQGVVIIRCGDGTSGRFINYSDTAKMEYSTTRRKDDWHPCTVTEEAKG